MDISRAECRFFRAFPALSRCPMLILTIMKYFVDRYISPCKYETLPFFSVKFEEAVKYLKRMYKTHPKELFYIACYDWHA